MIKWFILNFAGREKCRGCQSGSSEQMSYSSQGSSIRLSFPISSHHWQPQIYWIGKGRTAEFWCQVSRHYYSINQTCIDKRLPWIFDRKFFPEVLVECSKAVLSFAEKGLPIYLLWIPLKTAICKPLRFLIYFMCARLFHSAVCWCHTTYL